MDALSETHAEVETVIESFNERDIDDSVAPFAEEGTFMDPAQEEPMPKPEIGEYFAEVIDAFPDARIEVERVVTDEGSAAVEATFHGTHEGSFEGLPPTGQTIAMPYVAVVVISDEGVTSWREYWDKRRFAEQLGLTFPAIIGTLPRLVTGAVRERL